jgi:hypothetical protein
MEVKKSLIKKIQKYFLLSFVLFLAVFLVSGTLTNVNESGYKRGSKPDQEVNRPVQNVDILGGVFFELKI